MATTTDDKPQYDYQKIWRIVDRYEHIRQEHPGYVLVFQVYPYYFAFRNDARTIINANRSIDQSLLAEVPPFSEPLILDAADLGRQIDLFEDQFCPIKIHPVPIDWKGFN